MFFIKKNSVLLVVLTLTLVWRCQPKLNEIDKQLEQLHVEGKFNGSILVAKNGKLIYKKNIGFANLAWQIPIQSNTKFEIASLSKPFTTLLVLQLVEKGKIRLEGKIAEYIPEFTRKDGQDITIHHLLSHTSGLQDFVGLNCSYSSWTKKEFLDSLAQTPIGFKPGSQFQYASSTYILLKYIIEKVTGQSYEQNLKEHVLEIAGMTNTGVIHDHAIISNLAQGYVKTDSGYINAQQIANSNLFIGAASIFSTCEDLLKWDQALYTEKLLSAKYTKLMYKVVVPPYGYGWFISEDAENGKDVSHGGDIYGYTSFIDRRLKDKGLIVILSNIQSADRGSIIKVLKQNLPDLPMQIGK